MKPVPTNHYSVKAHCPDCGAHSIFDYRQSDREFGYIMQDGRHRYEGIPFLRVHWRMLRCSNCGRAGLAKFHENNGPPVIFESFHPRALEVARLPAGIPDGIEREYREAELCASVEAWRAASALLRSALEKTLKANSYTKGTLQAKIDEAARDGVITGARKQKAHEDVRVLGNEVVHDDYREVTEEEVASALHYVQRVLEDLYDDRPTVEALLNAVGRIPPK
ncbi:MAG: DUF4145 domain-containing protein [Gemmatimonadaceae bacterium]